jgi:UDP-N-acetylmuramate dehydrogenase
VERFDLPLASPQATQGARLAELTSFRIGGRPERLINCFSQDELIAAIRQADAADQPLLVMGGGSNLLARDDLRGLTVVRDRRGAGRAERRNGLIEVTVDAGASWDALVALTVERGWAGLAELSAIPGSAGATAVQNVGAYGAEVSQVIDSLRAFDRAAQTVVELRPGQLDFSYRDSALKRSMVAGQPTPRWVILDLTFRLQGDRAGSSINYGQLAAQLGVAGGTEVPLDVLRRAVIDVRRGKGMVLRAGDHDTWSAGSFFTNPVIPAALAAALPAAAPRFAAPDGAVKTSAAWLISQAGIGLGQGVRPGARATTSTKHVLALTNRGGATCDDVLELADWIVKRVADRFGITLIREPVLVG